MTQIYSTIRMRKTDTDALSAINYIQSNSLSDKLTNPVFLVNILVSIPFASQKGIFFRDDFTVKECRQRWKLLRETFDLQVSTEITVFLVHMLQRDKRDMKNQTDPTPRVP